MKIEDPRSLSLAAVRSPGNAPPLERSRVLLAGPRATVKQLSDALRGEGYVLGDATLATALEQSYAFAPDLVLLEAHAGAPQADELCRQLELHSGPAAPAVIFVVPERSAADVAELLAAGAVDMLFQPLRTSEVAARVRLHLLNRARDAQLAQGEMAKTRLLCMAAHDLRNPLVSIRALTHLVRSGTVGVITPAQRDLLDTIYDASQSMLNLVNELLDASVHQAGELTITPHPASLADVVASSVKIAGATAGEKGSHIVLEPGPLPPAIAMDEPKIRQVLSNLLGNAIKFSPPGSRITVATASNEFECSVTVRDQGPGIRESERDRLFKDFSRAAAKPTGGESSTGLGLAICQKIMQAHAGTISVENAPDGGAIFRIALPILA